MARILGASGRRATRLRGFLDRFRLPEPDPVPYVPGETRIFPAVWRLALLGFAGSFAVLLGGSQETSPFTSNGIHGSWYFGIAPTPQIQGQTIAPGSNLFISLVLVYAGMVLMMRAWLGVAKLTSRHPGIPVRKLVPIFVLWMLPLLVIAPLFSRDAYSYATQGEMMSRGINPYVYPPSTIGIGNINPWITTVDTLWRDSTSPYGPAFLGIDGFIVTLTGHSPLVTIIGLRLMAVVGTVLMGVYLPRLARSYGYDGASAFVLSVMNPLILLHLVGGAHNDALMLGLLAAGLATARRGHPVLGIVLCTIGAGVKIPAIVGVVYIGWYWLGDDVDRRRRIWPVAAALGIAVVAMEAISEAMGLGWGWISGLSNPDAVRSWMDPPTAVGLYAGKFVQAVGLGDHSHVILSAARGLGLLLAVAISARLLWKSRPETAVRALGLTLLAMVVLGPVVQPWYLAWGVVVLATVATGRIRLLVVTLSCCASFLGLPGGAQLLRSLRAANPLLIAGGVLALAFVCALLLGPRVRVGLASRSRRGSAAEVESLALEDEVSEVVA
ncbi:MAG TPA: polyprenol phosphomannose-dependent alpha 1,6 mannosyltransferase MptB [Acidimicrobiales bacterium]|nr:polyprenol phosphomannose-dependent alpha 1,6 mannosyltransferase MptB [Acidimicrobiales bacterium]